MTPLGGACLGLACTFAGALAGMAVGRSLPGHQLDERSRNAVQLSAGMISLLAALVLGLLVSSAKASFDAANEAIVQGGVRVILLDRVLARYGPEAKPIRDGLRQSLASMIAVLWPDEHPTASGFAAFESTNAIEPMLDAIRGLEPRNELQRELGKEAEAIANEILRSRWLQIEQAQTPLPRPFVSILLFWLTVLYVHFGLLAPRNATVVTVMGVGALSLATALFLILEMNAPLEGFIKSSSAPLEKALTQLGR